MLLFLLWCVLSTAVWADRADKVVSQHDSDDDGRLSAEEWHKGAQRFRKIDTDSDGYVTAVELRAWFRKRDGGGGRSEASAAPDDGKRVDGPPSGQAGSSLDGEVPYDQVERDTRCGIGRGRQCDIGLAVALGLFETGLKPRFPAGLRCRDIDEGWAIPYTGKRNRESYHGGIDMPAPFGTPIIAVADGVVVSMSEGPESYRGREIILRHRPEDTGLPVWTYTQYAHFERMPDLKLGQRVRMGQVLGPTGNSGYSPGGKERRPAIHFAVWFSDRPEFTRVRSSIAPLRGQWMDPLALYRGRAPFDSASMRALPESEKEVPIAVMIGDGEVLPAGSRVIWPYRCE